LESAIRRIEDCMTAQIFDLEAERAKRAARLPKVMPSTPPQWRLSHQGNPYTTVDGYHIVVFKRGGTWAFRIELTCTEREWYSERRYQTEDAARSDALLAVRQLGRSPRQA
jgi:hypothetical protein